MDRFGKYVTPFNRIIRDRVLGFPVSCLQSPAALAPAALAHATLPKLGPFQDLALCLANPAHPFNPIQHLPSYWASQDLGHNVTVSLALHLQLTSTIVWSRPLQSLHRYSLLAVAASRPSMSHPCQLLPAAAIYYSAASFSSSTASHSWM
jgi:hypothetical protein